LTLLLTVRKSDFINKKKKKGNGSSRMCVDYRALNRLQ
jgi:hypothetical protein